MVSLAFFSSFYISYYLTLVMKTSFNSFFHSWEVVSISLKQFPTYYSIAESSLKFRKINSGEVAQMS